MEKIGTKVDRVIEFLIALLFISMVIAGGFQVFNRFILNESLSWSEEFQKFTHIWIIFLTIPVVYNRGGHIGMEFLFNKLSARMQKTLLILFDLLWLTLAISITFYTIVIMNVARFQTSAGLGIRMDLIYSGLVIGSLYLLFISVRKLKVSISSLNSLKVDVKC
jgi:TRAP-type C4-dicarboxylate transport system permease small subunit